MLNHDLRVGNYGRVSGDKQAKDGTIASQLEAIRERVASDGLVCDPDLCFVDDGYSGDTLVAGSRTTSGPSRRWRHRSPLHSRSRSNFAEVCISGVDTRGTHSLRC